MGGRVAVPFTISKVTSLAQQAASGRKEIYTDLQGRLLYSSDQANCEYPGTDGERPRSAFAERPEHG